MSEQLPLHYVEISRLLFDQLKNWSAMEVNIVRPFIRRSLQAFYKHDSPELIPDPERVSDRRPQAVSNAPRRQLRR
ncbi:hypothetical protein L6164_007822 [Bauhinia variegata]|uniref:Uncharacterized protein n=1 Tax=Bauhinia variegata TaxID=167791 RepID=A0ACB9PDP4_BAUVA|nr:hypothetical protein L6164_007822 [Bauhinia variegata]